MPGGDRTGPWGAGPMTGRGAGFCAGYGMPGYMNPIPGRGAGFGGGRGRGMGRGFGGGGRGWRNMYYATGLPGWARSDWPMSYAPQWGAPYSEKEELAGLRDQAKYFNDALAEIRRRIEELEKRQEG